MNVRLKRAKELVGYAVRLTKDEGLPTMVKRGAGFVKRRCFGKRARYLPTKKVLEAQRAEMAGKTAADCGLPTISILTPLYNTPEKYLREFLDSFVGQTAPNGQLCLADASDAAHGDVECIIKEYQQKNQQIVYKKIENQGIAANTNDSDLDTGIAGFLDLASQSIYDLRIDTKSFVAGHRFTRQFQHDSLILLVFCCHCTPPVKISDTSILLYSISEIAAIRILRDEPWKLQPLDFRHLTSSLPGFHPIPEKDHKIREHQR